MTMFRVPLTNNFFKCIVFGNNNAQSVGLLYQHFRSGKGGFMDVIYVRYDVCV